MSEKPTENHIQNICAIVEERDKKLCEIDAKCKYYKDMIETDTAEINLIQKDIRRINHEDKEAQKQLEQIDFILKSLRENQNVLTESLINHQTLDKMLSKELKAKQTEFQQIENEFRDLYERSRSKITDNPLFKELEKAKVKFRKANIELRSLKLQIAQKKKIIAEKRAIQEKRYYAFFIRMAEDYLVDKKMKELQELKKQKLIAIKRVYEYQENLKAKKKLAIPKMEMFKNIIFGSQSDHIEEQPQANERPSSHNKIQTPTPLVLKQQQPLQLTKAIPNLREKLNILREAEEVEPVEIPRKVRIIEQVVAPAITAPHFVIPENPEPINNFSKTLQRLVKTTGSKKPSSPQVDESIAIQSTQQSEAGQLSEEAQSRVPAKMVTPVITTLPQFDSPEMRQTRVIKLSKKWQSMIKNLGFQDQLSPQAEDSEMAQLSEKSDLEQSFQQSRSADKITSLPVVSDDQSMPPLAINQKSIILATEVKNQNEESYDQMMSRNVAESKSVRFNVESMCQKAKESSGMFSQAMFQNPFQSFLDRKTDLNNTLDSKQTEEVMSNLSKDDFNNTESDFNNSTSGFKFYEDVSDQDEQSDTAESGPFGGENMFSFGLNKPLFPFQ
ncbi:uncharacterized protein LOC109544395 [Dendroctonus ponderosae]|uniref:uncharacterized protein LOC109544395 n=1 Tax=Dendroctonus ponderosae TaxID=77166 RepID=UPI002034CDE6|nr:uncharacterized protein LOC109544395 [Dendroctonus ponderosae]KAH1027607.1 hypothetical protein HUJ05_001084 [Dendroctonus ponderosae]